MIKGRIKCECGSSFSYESILDTIDCPDCGKEHKTKEHGSEESEDEDKGGG